MKTNEVINTVINDDCLNVMKDLPDKCIDLVLTDPPYGIDYQSNTIKKGKFVEVEGDKSLDFFEPFFKEAIRVLKDNSHFYLFFNWKTYPEIYHLVKPYLRNMLVIKRRKSSQGDLESFSTNYEICLFMSKGKKVFNTGIQKVSETSLNDIRYEGDGFLKRYPALIDYYYNSEFDLKMIHPTQKNIELISFLTKISSNPDDIILDPFLGSGTTAVAAKQLGRKFIGIEISEKYCKMANERLRQDVLL